MDPDGFEEAMAGGTGAAAPSAPLYDVAAQRLAAIDPGSLGGDRAVQRILGDEGYDAFLALDPDDLPDGGLFA